MHFKVSFGKEIHIVNSEGRATFTDFKLCLPTIFKKLPDRFMLSYIDQDGDQITITNDHDYKIMLETGLKYIKILLKEVEKGEFYDQTQIVELEEEMPKDIVQEVSPKEIPEIKLIDE